MFLSNNIRIKLEPYMFKLNSKVISYLNRFLSLLKYNCGQIGAYHRCKIYFVKPYFSRYESKNFYLYTHNSCLFNYFKSIKSLLHYTKYIKYEHRSKIFYNLICLLFILKINIIHIFNNKKYLLWIFKLCQNKNNCALTVVNNEDPAIDSCNFVHGYNTNILKELNFKKETVYVYNYINKNILSVIEYNLLKIINKKHLNYLLNVTHNNSDVNLLVYYCSILYRFICRKHLAKLTKTYCSLYIYKNIKTTLYNFNKYFLTVKGEAQIYSNNKVIYRFYNIINKFIFGQSVVTKKITSYISNFNYSSQSKPLGSFLLCGPSGTGKTELVKLITSYLYKSQSNLIQFDMSEYKEVHSISKLIGSPPGYVGHEEGGNLVNKINSVSYPVILFDEIEKANKNIFSIFLQILDEGILSDSRGNLCRFNKSLIFFTSNLGSKIFTNLNKNEKFGVKYYNKVKKDINSSFKLEFINRLNDIIIFNPLLPVCLYSVFDKYVYSDSSYKTVYTSTQIKSMLSYLSYSTQQGSRVLMNNINKIINSLNVLELNKVCKTNNSFIKYLVL